MVDIETLSSSQQSMTSNKFIINSMPSDYVTLTYITLPLISTTRSTNRYDNSYNVMHNFVFRPTNYPLHIIHINDHDVMHGVMDFTF